MSAQDKDAVLRQFGRKRNHVETDRVLEHPDGTESTIAGAWRLISKRSLKQES